MYAGSAFQRHRHRQKSRFYRYFLENGLAQAIQTQPAACFLIGELRQTI